MVNASRCSSSRIRRIQKAHIAFVPTSAAKRKNTINSRKIQAKKTNKKRQYTGKTFLFRKRNFASQKSSPIELLSAGGYRQISTVTQFQAHPSELLHWARGPCSRAAGGSLLLTGAVLKAHSAGGVSGSFGRSVLKPKLLDAGLLSFVSSPGSPSRTQVIPKIPNFCRTRLFSYRRPH